MNHHYGYPDDGKKDMVGELCSRLGLKPLVSTGGGVIRLLASKLGVDYRNIYELMALDVGSSEEQKPEILETWLKEAKEKNKVRLVERTEESFF